MPTSSIDAHADFEKDGESSPVGSEKMTDKVIGAASKQLHEAEVSLPLELRKVRQQPMQQRDPRRYGDLSFGQRLADRFASTMGSWSFFIKISMPCVNKRYWH
jgi:hypothetical protein